MLFYTYAQLRDLLGVSQTTVETMARDGRLPPPVKLGPSRSSPARFPKAEVEAAIAKMSRQRRGM